MGRNEGKISFTIEQHYGSTKIINETDLTLTIRSKPIPPRRKSEILNVIRAGTFHFYDQGNIDLTKISFTLEESK